MQEAWVEALRAEFPAAEKLAFFDTAYENCGSRFARQAAEQFFDDKAEVGPGLVKAGGAGKGPAIGVIAETRRLLSELINAEGIERMAFTANTTQGINLVLQSYPFKPGDSVVVAAMEHVAVLMPCLWLRRKGVNIKLVKPENPMLLTEDDLLAAADETTRFIVCSWVQSASGCKVDMKALTCAAHFRDIYVLTDVIQGIGFEPVDVREMGMDALSASPYKGMLGIEGMGFLYVNEKLCRELSPVFSGDGPVMTIDREKGEIVYKPGTDERDARKLEAGTIPMLSIYCLNAALKRMAEIGQETIAAHVLDCYNRVYDGLTALGYAITTSRDPARHSHSMIVQVGGDPHIFVEWALERGVYLSGGRNGHVRVSVAPFTTDDDIEKLLTLFRDYAGRQEA